MKKEKKDKNEKIKEIIMKLIHIVSYILSVGFIIVCVLVGVGSCNKQVPNKQARIEPQIQERINQDSSTYQYYLANKSSFISAWSEQTNPDTHIAYIDISTNCKIMVNGVGSYFVNFNFNEGLLTYQDNEITNDYDYLKFVMYYNGDTLVLQWIYLENDIGNLSKVIYQRSNNTINNTSFYLKGLEVVSDNLLPYPSTATFNYKEFLSQFFNVYDNENLHYYFDVNTLNPIQYLTYEITGDNLAHNTGSWTAKIDLTDLIFTSNGITFKAIRYQYDYVLGAYANGQEVTFNDMTYLALSYIAYQDYFTSEWYKVCYPRIYKIETRTLNNTSQLAKYPFTDFSTYLWTNEGFKNIEIINGSNQVWSTLPADPLAYLTYYQILNYEGTLNNVYIEGTNGTNVFVILANGFKSVSSLFAIGLLPGITIGTLLFLPLVVVIIFAIIKIIHK